MQGLPGVDARLAVDGGGLPRTAQTFLDEGRDDLTRQLNGTPQAGPVVEKPSPWRTTSPCSPSKR
jgi:hypothetical protein